MHAAPGKAVIISLLVCLCHRQYQCSMSDFGSLLSQFKSDVKQLPAKNNRSLDEETIDRPLKRPRQEHVDASSFPPVKQVYCLCPAGVQTGGPEALHQLCDEINRCSKHTVQAYMLYVTTSGGRIIHAARAQKPIAYIDLYDAPVATSDNNPLVKDSSSTETLLVWPECFTNEMLDYLDNNTNTPCQCAIWWLSVNNNTGKFQEWHRKDIIHLYQSLYAKTYITSKGATYVYPMTEYISLVPASDDNKKRSIDVLYNPLKGMHYTDAIKKRSGSVMNIRPIGQGPDGRERVSPEQVHQLLQCAKIYCDFGPHPGMDRLPREAALAGCCVVTNRENAANYDEDVPLPSRYKVKNFNADTIHKLFMDLLNNFDERSKDFGEYREWIRGQKERMKDCVSTFLNEVVEKRKQQIS